MKDLYFACNDCKIYIDAGHRWAYIQLENTGIVSRGAKVDVEDVLRSRDYWNPPDNPESRWLRDEVIPAVRDFLNKHQKHSVVFGREEDFAPLGAAYLDWMQVGYLPQPSARSLVESMGMKSWDDVLEYVGKKKIPPAWWDIPPFREQVRQRVEELIQQTDGEHL
jgi:hypothetical protein